MTKWQTRKHESRKIQRRNLYLERFLYLLDFSILIDILYLLRCFLRDIFRNNIGTVNYFIVSLNQVYPIANLTII